MGKDIARSLAQMGIGVVLTYHSNEEQGDRAAEDIRTSGGGGVFITAAGDWYNVPGYAAYSACKGAVEAFSRYVAKEYDPRGIRANTVAPGSIVTDFNNGAIRSNPKAQEWIIAQTPTCNSRSSLVPPIRTRVIVNAHRGLGRLMIQPHDE